MKLRHILLIIVLLSIAIDSNSLEIHGELKLGKDLFHEDQLGFVNLDLSLDQDIWLFNIKLYGGIKTWFQFRNFNDWLSPFRVTYEFGSMLSIDVFFIDVYHFCSHPVLGDYMREGWNAGNSVNWQQWLTTLSVGVKW